MISAELDPVDTDVCFTSFQTTIGGRPLEGWSKVKFCWLAMSLSTSLMKCGERRLIQEDWNYLQLQCALYFSSEVPGIPLSLLVCFPENHLHVYKNIKANLLPFQPKKPARGIVQRWMLSSVDFEEAVQQASVFLRPYLIAGIQVYTSDGSARAGGYDYHIFENE